MTFLFANSASSTLASGITNSDLSLTVDDGAEFPSPSGDEFRCKIFDAAGNWEIIKVTARSTDTFTITRGEEGTTGLAWDAGDVVSLRVTKETLESLQNPAYTARTEGLDTGGLTGATVISDLDFNLSSDVLGHVTACDFTNALTRELTPSDIGAQASGTGTDTDLNTSGAQVVDVISLTDGIVTSAITTRDLTLANLGYTGTADANTYVHPNHSGQVTSAADGAQSLAVTAISAQTPTTTVADTDEMLINDGGVLRKVAVSDVGDHFGGGEIGVISLLHDDGGGTVLGINVTRDFNTVVINTIAGASYTEPTLTLPAGTYQYNIELGVYDSKEYLTGYLEAVIIGYIYNLSDTINIAASPYNSKIMSTEGTGSPTRSHVHFYASMVGVFTIASSKNIQVRQTADSDGDGGGKGFASGTATFTKLDNT